MKITSETNQSGTVSHEVERDGADVRIKASFDDHITVRKEYSITPEHARQLAKALMDCADEAERK